MVQVDVERAVKGRHGRDEKDQPAARREDRGEIADRSRVVFDVFQNVQADDGVRPFGQGFGTVGSRKAESGTTATLTLAPVAELGPELRLVVRLDVRSHDPLPVEEKPGLVAHARADLEDPPPRKRSNILWSQAL